MTQLHRLVLLAALTLLVAGCEGAKSHAAPTAIRDSKTSQGNERAALLKAVRTAVAANARLSGVVLWTNVIPSSADRSTGGPALASLRSAAAGRRKQGIRIRTLSEHTQVLSIDLKAPYTQATVVVRARETLAPYKAGRRLGRAINLNERARIELRRSDHANRFLVWSVTPLP
jgi:hypothetical protein